jgi:hypothetical protein
MSDTQNTPSAANKADEAMARFEARMADHEKRTRPKRTRDEVLDEAINAVELQLKDERAKLDRRFSMAAQEQAQRETVQDLEWLVHDLHDLRAGNL